MMMMAVSCVLPTGTLTLLHTAMSHSIGPFPPRAAQLAAVVQCLALVPLGLRLGTVVPPMALRGSVLRLRHFFHCFDRLECTAALPAVSGQEPHAAQIKTRRTDEPQPACVLFLCPRLQGMHRPRFMMTASTAPFECHDAPSTQH